MIRFESPLFLLALLVIPVLVWARSRRQVVPSLTVPGLAGTGALRRTMAARRAELVPWLKYLALVLLIVAVARPQWGVRKVDVVTEGINIVLVVDISFSMGALDFAVDGKRAQRLDAVKKVVSEFVEGRQGDRVGLAVFGSEAYTQAPLTRDYKVIVQTLERVQSGSAGPATAMGDGIAVGLKRLKDVKSKSNVIVLLTDGRSNAGEFSPEAAANLAEEAGVKIYTIGVGTKGDAPIVQQTKFGPRLGSIRADIDEDTLRKVAEKTGGLYFRATDTEGLETIYKTIDEMEKTSAKVKEFDNYKDLYQWAAGPALVLLLVWAVLANTRFVRVP